MALEQFIGAVPPWIWIILFGVLGLIKIPFIEINIWSIIGKAINGEVLEKVEELTEKFNKQVSLEEEEKARNARTRILRFNDEILLNRKHSKEHFEEILQDIDMYENYCQTHPEYKNSRAVFAINTIKTVYQKCLDEKDFLAYGSKNRDMDGE